MPKEIKFDAIQFIMIMLGFWWMSALMVWYSEHESQVIVGNMSSRAILYMQKAQAQVDLRDKTLLKCEDGIRKQQEIETLKAQLNDAERLLKRRHVELVAGLEFK